MNEKAQNLFPVSALFLIVVCLLLPGIAEAGTSCTATSTYDDHLDANDDAANGDDGYCLSTPSSLVLKLYEFAICTAEADPSDTSMCTKLFEKRSR